MALIVGFDGQTPLKLERTGVQNFPGILGFCGGVS